ncbi:MAG: metal ABC transporter permease [Alphaproteobacteria bacterium]|nr:MAG: metal ABC transporter permease [Alphaproteobacteria bacterium]
MNTVMDIFLSPFADFAFMRKALVGCCLLSMGAAPLGVLLILRRMSLMGEAISHAVLPGIAASFLLFGLSVPAMGLGGMLAGLAVAILVGLATRLTQMKEDAHLAAFYLIALALGVLLISWRGTSIDLMHLLFGSVLAADDVSLGFMACITSVTLSLMAVFYRPLIAESFDPLFMRMVHRNGTLYHLMFLMLVVINMVAGFQTLGTLMSVGLMMLPAAAARFWSHGFMGIAGTAVGIGVFSGYFGLLLSYHNNVPSGPAIILTAGAVYMVSLLCGPLGSVRARYFTRKHFTN